MSNSQPPLPMPVPKPPRLPRAAAAQTETGPEDQFLLGAARRRHPTVVWWWGMRDRDHGFGAWCYICERMLVTWARRWPMTVRAGAVVDEHRARHLSLLRIDRSIGLVEAGPIEKGTTEDDGDTETE